MMNFKTVYYDINSVFEFNELNESQYLHKLFHAFEKISDDLLKEYEIYIFANYDVKILPDCISYTSTKKKILYYLADAAGSIDPGTLAPYFDLIFKTHLREEFVSEKVLPVSLGYVNDVPELPIKAITERKFNVFFSGDLNRNRIDLYRSFFPKKKFIPKRGLPSQLFRDLLIKYKYDFSDFFPDSQIIFNNGFKTGLSSVEYGEKLADSKIILSPKGFGNAECFRNIEAMRAGCVIISDKLPKYEIYEASPIIQIEDWKEGLSWAKKLLKDNEMMKDYHLKTVDWWENKCSEEAVANYLKDRISEIRVNQNFMSQKV